MMNRKTLHGLLAVLVALPIFGCAAGSDPDLDAALAEIGMSRRVMLALPHFHSVAVAVARSDLIAALPRQMAEAVADHLDLAIHPLPIEIPAQELRLYWHRRHDRHPAHCWLRGQIVDIVGTISEQPV